MPVIRLSQVKMLRRVAAQLLSAMEAAYREAGFAPNTGLAKWIILA